MENYEGSKLIIKGTNSSDTGESCRNFGCKLSVIFQGGIVARNLAVSSNSGTTWKSKVFPIPIPTFFQEPWEFAIYGILDKREFVERLQNLSKQNLSEQEKTLLNTTGERVLKKENSISISREGVEHRIICSFTDREAKVGFLYFIMLLIKIIFSDLVDKIQLEKGYLWKPRSEDTH